MASKTKKGKKVLFVVVVVVVVVISDGFFFLSCFAGRNPTPASLTCWYSGTTADRRAGTNGPPQNINLKKNEYLIVL